MKAESGRHKPQDSNSDSVPRGNSLNSQVPEQGITGLGSRATDIVSTDDLIRAATRRAAVNSGLSLNRYILGELDSPRVLRNVPQTGDIDAVEATADALDSRARAKDIIEGEIVFLESDLKDSDRGLRRAAAQFPEAVERVDTLADKLRGHQDDFDPESELWMRVEDGVGSLEQAKKALLELPGEVKGFASAVRQHDPDFAFEGSSPPRIRNRDRSTFTWPEHLADAAEIGAHFKISPRIVGELLVDMEGRQNFGGKGVGFPRDEAMALMPELLDHKAQAAQRRREADPAVTNRSPLTELTGAHDITVETGRRIVKQYGLDPVIHGANHAKFYDDKAFAAAIEADNKAKAAPAGKYDKEGKTYVNLNYIFEETGVNHYTAMHRLGKVPTDVGRRGETIYLWDESTQGRINTLVETPRADTTTGIYTDPSKSRIAPLGVLREMTGLSYDKLRQFAEGESGTEIIAKSGQVVTGYDVDAILAKASGYKKRRHTK